MQRSSMYMVLALIAMAGATVWTMQRPAERGMQRLQFAKAMRKAVDRIDVTGAHKAALYNDGGVWRVQGGRPADVGAVARALRAVSEFQSTDWLTDDEANFADYQVLGAKSSDVRLESKGQVVASFTLSDDPEAVGDPNIRSGEQVFRATGELASALLRDEKLWTDRHLFDLREEDVVSVQAHVAGEPPYTLQREPAGAWTLPGQEGRPPLRFDPSAASSLVSVLFSTEIGQYIDAPMGDDATGLAEKDADRLVLSAKGDGDAAPKVATLWLGNTEKADVYARVDGAGNQAKLFTLPQSQVEAFRRRRDDLRALTLFGAVDAAELVEAGIERPGQKPMRFVRHNDAWTLASAKPYAAFKLDSNKVQQRLRRATLARAMGIAGPSEGKMLPSMGLLWLKSKDGVRHEVRVGAKVKAPKDSPGVAAYWAKGSADGLTYKVSRPLYDDLFADMASLEAVQPSANKAAPPAGPNGLDQLPPDVRAKLEQQLAQQAHAG